MAISFKNRHVKNAMIITVSIVLSTLPDAKLAKMDSELLQQHAKNVKIQIAENATGNIRYVMNAKLDIVLTVKDAQWTNFDVT